MDPDTVIVQEYQNGKLCKMLKFKETVDKRNKNDVN